MWKDFATMDDMEKDELEKTDEMLDSFSDGIELSDGIEKNLLKAGWMLTAGLVNIPLQKIERHLAEKKSESDARIMVNQTVAQRISDQLDVSEEFVTLAATKFFGNIVQEQLNLDSIFEKAQLSLHNTPQDETNTDQNIGEISDDWLNEFRGVACKKSSQEAQDLFSKVLTGEVRKPGSISLKALTTLADMDQKVAQLFQTFCSLCFVQLADPKMYHLTQSKSHFKIVDARIPLLTENFNDVSIFVDKQGDSTSKFANMSQSI